MTEYVVPTLVLHPSLRAAVPAMDDAKHPADAALSEPSLRAITYLGKARGMQTRSAALLVLIFLLAVAQVALAVAVVLVIVLDLVARDVDGDLYSCILQPIEPPPFDVCEWGYVAGGVSITLSAAAALVECLPCNAHHAREVASIVLHVVGFLLWTFMAILFFGAASRADVYFLSISPEDQSTRTPLYAVRTLLWVLCGANAACFGSMAMLQTALTLRRARARKVDTLRERGGLVERPQRQARIAHSSHGEILVAYQGWHREVFMGLSPMPLDNGANGNGARGWRAQGMPSTGAFP